VSTLILLLETMAMHATVTWWKNPQTITVYKRKVCYTSIGFR